MHRLVITAQVDDVEAWEAGFRTHGDLFRSQTIASPIRIAIGEGNMVALYMEVDDLDTFTDILDSPATEEAMEFDGVHRDTVRVFELDREFHI